MYGQSITNVGAIRSSMRIRAPLSRRSRARQGRCLDLCKSAVGVKGDGPDQVGAYGGENESHPSDVEKGETQKSIGQEATPDDELKIPADVQQRVRRSTVCLRLPDSQVSFRTSASELVSLEPDREETRNFTS